MTGDVAALNALLSGEHAAIWGYGTAGAVLGRLQASAQIMSVVRPGFDAHRMERDQLADAIAAAGGQPPAPEPAYQLPFTLSDVSAALRLLIGIEDRLATLAAAAVGFEAGRNLAADVLSASAARATRLRLLNGVAPAKAANAFPGLPSFG